MAFVEKRGQGQYRARYRGSDGYERSRTFSRKVDAERFLTTVEGDKLDGRWTDPNRGRITFKAFASSWLETKDEVEEHTRTNIEGRLRNHYGYLNGMRLSSIKPSDILGWRKTLRAELSNDTINSSLGTLRQIFRLAVRDGVIPQSPAQDIVPLPGNRRKQIHPLTITQVLALADEIDPRFRAAILFDALGSGTRRRAMGSPQGQRRLSKENHPRCRVGV